MKLSRKITTSIVGLTALGILAMACSSSVVPTAEQLQPEQPAPAAPAPEPRAEAPARPQTALPAPAAPAPPAPAPAPISPGTSMPPSAMSSQPIRAASEDSSKAHSMGQALGAPAPTSVPQHMAAPAPAPSVVEVYSGASGEVEPHRYPRDYAYYPYGDDYLDKEPYDTTFFQNYGVNPFVDTRQDHLSTFAMDVDTASYSVARRFLSDGYLPDPDSVRVEEFVNYFEQGYEAPFDDAFAIQLEGAPSPFGEPNHLLMRVGIQGKELFEEERKDATLIFVIDTSGSMGRQNRIETVKQSLRVLVDELRSTDRVGIVEYGNRGHVLLKPTDASNRREILDIINYLHPNGSTNAEEGLTLGYDLAIKEVDSERITRVILLSDGVANVGRTGPDAILKRIRHAVEEGVTLSTVGVGMGNYNDILLEQLANDGDGSYYYIDTYDEAKKVFREDLTGTLQIIARDAKVQVDFNPEVVMRYRLIGYENRDVADRDFRNDLVDAGEVGAGHSVTALYEVELYDDTRFEDAEGLVSTVFLRYEDPDTGIVHEVNRDFYAGDFAPYFEATSPRFQLTAAVAEYAEILRESYWARNGNMHHVLTMAEQVQRQLPRDTEVSEFVSLVAKADRLSYHGHP